MYVCLCNAVTEKQVREAQENGATTLEDLRRELDVATGCGQCAVTACAMLKGEDCLPTQPSSDLPLDHHIDF